MDASNSNFVGLYLYKKHPVDFIMILQFIRTLRGLFLESLRWHILMLDAHNEKYNYPLNDYDKHSMP